MPEFTSIAISAVAKIRAVLHPFHQEVACLLLIVSENLSLFQNEHVVSPAALEVHASLEFAQYDTKHMGNPCLLNIAPRRVIENRGQNEVQLMGSQSHVVLVGTVPCYVFSRPFAKKVRNIDINLSSFRGLPFCVQSNS
jgi:hypothetical protein